MESYIDSKKKLYSTILDYLEVSDETNQQSFEIFCENMRNFNIEGDQEQLTQFILAIKNISDNHHREMDFIQKIKEILQHYKDQIKQTLSNDEIFHFFANNKLIVHFLLKNDIITFSESICNYMVNKIEPNGYRYCYFFYPELEKLKGEDKMKFIKEEILLHNPTAFDHFEENRQVGENDSYICSLIRNDSVEEFISYMNRNNYSLSSQIVPSIFETNLFLIDHKTTTLIEYSAFYGSIQLFQYLLMNQVDLTPSLWLYSIHSKNAELIHLLESNRIIPPESKFNKKNHNTNENHSYLACLVESIKCHHNDFSDYFENNLMNEDEMKSKQIKEEILSNIMKYHNYLHFQAEEIKEQGFFYLHFYNYNQLFDLLLKEKEKEIKKKIIL